MPSARGSLKNADRAFVRLCHLLFAFIDPELSTRRMRSSGATSARFDEAAQAAASPLLLPPSSEVPPSPKPTPGPDPPSSCPAPGPSSNSLLVEPHATANSPTAAGRTAILVTHDVV